MICQRSNTRMTCSQCQHETPVGAVFCDECGTRLEAACAACGEPNRLEAKFGRKCGQSLVHIERASQSGVARFTSPASCTPTHLAEKILTSRAALEGERKQVTVLFADLKGSRSARATAPADLRGSPLDRRRDASPARQPGRKPRLGAGARARELPARVSARLDRKDVLQPDATGRAPRGERRGVPGRAARRRCRSRSTQAAPW